MIHRDKHSFFLYKNTGTQVFMSQTYENNIKCLLHIAKNLFAKMARGSGVKPTRALCLFQYVFTNNSAHDVTWRHHKVQKGNWGNVLCSKVKEKFHSMSNPGCCAALQGKRWPFLTRLSVLNARHFIIHPSVVEGEKTNALKTQNRSQLWSLGRLGSTVMQVELRFSSLRGRCVTHTP